MMTNRKFPVLLVFLLLSACILASISQADEDICPVPTMTGTITYPSSWSCGWFIGNPDEIARNQNGVIELRGGRPPYQWQVSGNGFWFDAAHTITSVQTTDPSVRAYADSSACGSATIHVTDGSSCSQSGTVRTSAGDWVLVTRDQCVMPGAYNYTFGAWYGLVRGGMKQELLLTNIGSCSSGAPGYSCSNPYPGANCSSSQFCQYPGWCIQNGVGCQDCLETGAVPCVNSPGDGGSLYNCYCVNSIYYYEWRCN
jgi:hypothetical protein